ncbi:unnamed protein product [Ceutorhynchus assimilis]|uniref:Uncharacterized protein n=1 Tax=Ceutorhynchus assimilis TaxID=467358 RepID=A0A9N9MQ08_9CUCU|nr:unnamed protein product [Ceutorhynchus assimilis]
MSNDDRLNEALKNVAIHADPTWKYRDYDPLQQTNMNLHLTARHLNVQYSKWTKLVPRTVRDSIPQSKLAKYGNYEYDEAREMSYTSSVNKYDRLNDTFDKDDADEPWMMEEIDDLVASYLSYNSSAESICYKNKHRKLPCSKNLCEKSFQSPFLEATSFDEMVLKLHITSPYIKKLWEPFYYPQYQPKYVTQSKSKKLILFSSTACRLFSSVETEIENSDWLEEITADKEGSISMDLIEQFNISESVFFKNHSQPSISSPPKDDSPSKRSYSAVLQGGPINQQPQNDVATCSTSYAFPPLKAAKNIEKICEWPYLNDKNLELAKRNEVLMETLTNKQHKSTSANIPATTNTLEIQRPKTTTTFPMSYPNYQYLTRQQQANFINPRLYSTNYISNTNVLNFRQTSYYPLLLHNAAVPYQQPFRPHYRQNVIYPQIRPQLLLPNQNLLLQPKQTIHILPRPPVASPSYNNFRNTSRYNLRPITPNNKLPMKDEKLFMPHIESIVTKTVNAVLEEPEPLLPLTETSSDELERQALEQYIPSSTDLFDELERQAIEEYDEDETSENWNSPPKYPNIAFGGCTRVKLFSVSCLKKVLGFLYFN